VDNRHFEKRCGDEEGHLFLSLGKENDSLMRGVHERMKKRAEEGTKRKGLRPGGVSLAGLATQI